MTAEIIPILDNTDESVTSLQRINAAQLEQIVRLNESWKSDYKQQAERIERLEAYILTITSIPGVCDIEKRIDACGFANPIKDARDFALKGG